MDREVIKYLFDIWKPAYYTDLIAIICQCLALFYGIKFYFKRKEGGYFLIYILSWLLCFTIFEYIAAYIKLVQHDMPHSVIFEEINIMVASSVEYYCFSYFLYRVSGKNAKRLIIVSYSAFAVLLLYFAFKIIIGSSPDAIKHLSYTISSVEMILLLIPTLLYFYKQLQQKKPDNLLKRPSFWILSSLLLYSVIVIPFFLVADKFLTSNRTAYYIGFTFHLTSFCLLFLALIKAFSLNKPLTS
jgi:hypothetical protein